MKYHIDYSQLIRRLLANIKYYRGAKRITQQAVASHLGISQNAYSKIERGITELTVNKLCHIALFLEVHLYDVLKVEEVKLSASIK
ncbi:MAG: helix-turn-helix transcriptional regulator [Bacteroidota bacterium]